MMKLFSGKSALSFLGLLMVLFHSCAPTEQVTIGTSSKPAVIETKEPEVKQPKPEQAETERAELTQPGTKPAAVEQKPGEEPVVKAPAEPSNIVAKIGDYSITKEELEKRLLKALRPRDEYGMEGEPPSAKTVLMEMIAEKAMTMEARKQNYLEDEMIRASLKQFTERKLVSLLLQTRLQDKITVTTSEIEEKIKTDPRLNRARAKAMLERAKANVLVDKYYSEIYKKFHIRKLSDNFFKAARIHQRLLLRPKEPRTGRWIKNKQVRDELTAAEKNIVLATYDNGKVTLKDWFDTLTEIAPPSRPRDLNTPKGVEGLLDRTLKVAAFVSEAKLLGFDKDEDLVKQIKEREDMMLLNKARQEKVEDIKGPTAEEQIIAYFNKNKESFGTKRTLKIDQVWCQDLKTAREVKAELDSGKDLESVRQKYSLQKKGRPFNTYPSDEAIFFKDLWKGEPNKIVGPVKGFYRNEVKWRIVKILEKKPGEPVEYSREIRDRVKWRMVDEQRDAVLEKYRKELLAKYSYGIYAERIRDIDPLDIP